MKGHKKDNKKNISSLILSIIWSVNEKGNKIENKSFIIFLRDPIQIREKLLQEQIKNYQNNFFPLLLYPYNQISQKNIAA